MGSHRLFETFTLDPCLVSSIVAEYWPGYLLGERLKASQNHTFVATCGDTRIIVRVTPDPLDR